MKKLGYAFALTVLLARGEGVSQVVNDGVVQTTPMILAAPGDNGLVEVQGTITGAALGGGAIQMNASNQKALNKGTIFNSTLNNGFGIFINGANAEAVNTGTISTTGSGGIGILNNGQTNARMINGGSIFTAGTQAIGIANENGANALLINTGLILTQNDVSQGMWNLNGTNAIMTNTGTISTQGTASMGLYNQTSTNAVVLNTGTIFTVGQNAVGIFNDGSTNTVIANSGSITTLGLGAHGISSGNAASNTLIVNSGVISARAVNTFGISVSQNTNVAIVNSGTISGPQTAINITQTPNPFLTLLRGSLIQGSVHVDTTPLILSVERGLNLLLTLDPTSIGLRPVVIDAPYVQVGNTIAVIDPTGLALQADVVADLSDTILNGVYRHRTAYPCCCYNACACGVWIEGLGSYRERNHSNIIGYHNWQGGFLVGYDRPAGCGNLGIFGGGTWGQAVVDQSTQKNTLTNYVVGLTYSGQSCRNFWGAALATGYTCFDNERFVMNNLAPGGVETATANGRGFFISPEITYALQLPKGWNCPLLPGSCSPLVSATLRYAGLFLGDFDESGSTADLSVEHRKIQLLTLRSELGLPFGASGGGCWNLEPYLGVSGRFQVADKIVDAELLGVGLSFDPGGPRNLVALLSGFRGLQQIGCVNFFLNLETSFDNDRSVRILGEGGIGLQF